MSTSSSESRQNRRRKERRAAKGSKIIETVRAGNGAAVVHIKERTDNRGWRYYAEFPHPETGKRTRPSLQTDDLDEARRNAQELADELLILLDQGSPEDLARVSQYRVTLGGLFDEFRRVRMARMLTKEGKATPHHINLDRVIRVSEAIIGRDQLVCETGEDQVDAYKAMRRAGGVTVAARCLPEQLDRWVLPADEVTLGPSGARTITGELRLLSVIFNWGARRKVPGGRGRTMLSSNPFKGTCLSAGYSEPRRPMMSDDRFAALMKHAPEAERVIRGEIRYKEEDSNGESMITRIERREPRFPDMPHGYMKTLLMVARGTARRIGSIRGLRVRDILLTEEAVRRKLIELGWPEEWAGAWPFGAIHWDPEFDKEGYSRVIPISARLHAELVTYLRGLGTIDPNAWLFPAPSRRDRRIGNGQVWRWLRKVEAVARWNGVDLPRLLHGAFQPHRRKWRSERAERFADKLVALVGGWSAFKNSSEAMNQGYLQFDPRALYLCAEFLPQRDLSPERPVAGVNTAVHGPEPTKRKNPTVVTPDSHTAMAKRPNRSSNVMSSNALSA